jgi:hypothetical protein
MLIDRMHEQPSARGPLHSRIVALLRRRVAITGQVVAATYEELAAELGTGVSAVDVHEALMDLGQRSYFSGRPHLGQREFRGRLVW